MVDGPPILVRIHYLIRIWVLLECTKTSSHSPLDQWYTLKIQYFFIVRRHPETALACHIVANSNAHGPTIEIQNFNYRAWHVLVPSKIKSFRSDLSVSLALNQPKLVQVCVLVPSESSGVLSFPSSHPCEVNILTLLECPDFHSLRQLHS